MRIVFFGSPAVAVRSLRAIVDAGHDVVLVVSGPDRRRGRGSATTPTPVKAAALEMGLRVTDDLTDAMSIDADMGVVVAYGRIIPNEMIERLSMVNIHFSMLPRWRGAAPVERAILAGDTSTGVCLMEVAEGLDTGAVYVSETVTIGVDETAAELAERLGVIGTRLLIDALEGGLDTPVPQSTDGVTYAHKITTADRELLPTMTAEQFLRTVRIGGAWTTVGGRRLKVLAASRVDDGCSMEGEPGSLVEGPRVVLVDGAVELVTVQPAGKVEMSGADWDRGIGAVGGRIAT